ncbi:MAG: VOC family protein [Beijerinckiaceae bacterium]
MTGNRLAITGVRKVEMEHADPERAAKFYTDVWNLSEVARTDGSIFMRATCAAHHVLAIHPANGPARVREIALGARGKSEVDGLYARAKAAGFDVDAPSERQAIDGGYGFSVRDPGGRRFSIVCGARDHDDDAKVRDRPYKIGHVNINTSLVDPMIAFYTDVFGMRLVDHAGTQYFFNADSPDHCSLVLCKYGMETLNHIAYEMSDLESVMRGAGRMHDAGYPIEWGPGRHGPGDNAFCYFAGPEECPLEYTAEVLQIDETYQFHGPDHWKWPPGRLDQWGVTPPHTTRWKRVQTLYGFAG